MFLAAQTGFLLLTLLCLLAVDRAFFPGKLQHPKKEVYRKRFWLVIGTWVVLISILSYGGFFSDFSGTPPRFFIMLIVPLISFLILFFNRSFIAYLDLIPVHQVILLQTFRVPVELLLWMLLLDRKLPLQMTFEGNNLDIITGLTAPVVAYMIYKRPAITRSLGILWNVGGFLLLVNIVSIAIMSTPTIFRVYMNEPANTVVALFPIVLLPSVLVPMAYYLHWFSIRQIIRK